MKTISRYIMTLALLLTAVTGAWAQTETPLVTIQDSENSTFTSGSKTFNNIATVTITGNGYVGGSGWENCTLTVTPADGVTITSVKFYGMVEGDVVEDTSSPFEAEIKYDSDLSLDVTKINGTKAFNYGVKKIEVYGTAEAPTTVAWNTSTKTGTFAMPGSDVVLTPIYAKAATFATTGTEPEVKPLLPEAAEGVIAGTDASLIAEGTGIVAFAGTSTDVTQGTLMYAVGTSATQAPALTAFSATAPTAKDVADDGATLYVWYYIKGANAPDGVAATLDNTFDDTEPAYITVTVLTNKFDITLKAANANTIEAGKATVTVGGQPATVTDGKLKAVKMGSEVKLEAKPGYKFRKVEVKKKAATPAVPDYYNKLTIINDDVAVQISVLKGLGRGKQAYNSSLTAAQAYALATYQAAIDGKAVYVIMSSQNSGYDIHYAVSTDASATEHTAELYSICDMDKPAVRMYYIAQ